MKKTDLIDMVAGITGGTKVQAQEIVESIFDTITGELARGGSVSIAGFGNFVSKIRAARTARNPRTGETVPVPEKQVGSFKGAKAFKDRIAAK